MQNDPALNQVVETEYHSHTYKQVRKLQGEKIETPEFIKKNNIPLDYYFIFQIRLQSFNSFRFSVGKHTEFKKKAVNFRAKLKS